MLTRVSAHEDECADVNLTSLVEDVVCEMDIYQDSDFNIHDEFFTLAYKLFDS